MAKDKDIQKAKKNPLLFGLTSFFTDMSSEMIYPMVPSFLMIIMKNATGTFLGVIEGIAEATASLGKVLFGYLADKFRNYKKLTIIGYGFSALSKVLFLVASFWTHVLGARFFDRVGKSIRTAPRDAILSESGEAGERGKTFGIQRALDFAGAMLGTILALIFIYIFGKYGVHIFGKPGHELILSDYRRIFLFALIPAVVGVGFLFFVFEPSSLSKRKLKDVKLNLSFAAVDPKIRTFMVATFLFALGNSSNMFIILRSRGNDVFGPSVLLSILPYVFYNLVATVFLPVFGKLSDRIGRRKVIVSGWLLYALVYAGFGLVPMFLHGLSVKIAFFGLWMVYGLFSAMTEGVEKAYVSDLSATSNRGTALGLFATVNGLGLLPASIIAGLLYSLHPSLPFVTGAGLSLAGALLMVGKRKA